MPAGHPATIADYAIVKVLGEGNNGWFYLARPPARLGLSADRVVLKVFSAQVSTDAYRRGVRELRAFAAVKCPQLVRIYDAVLEGSFLYAMEYLPMGSLAEPNVRLERAQIRAALADAARAVHALHENGMTHGDITPSNVLVTESGGKLSDLGLVRVLESGAAVTSLASTGSAEYQDPQVVFGQDPSRASDIFSLGATINRALGGTGLYGDLAPDQPMLVIRAVHAGDIRIAPGLSAAESALVAACVGPREQRPRTAAEVAAALDGLSG